jgi:hypothetical protein
MVTVGSEVRLPGRKVQIEKAGASGMVTAVLLT